MQPVDLNKLVEPFLDTGLYLAVTKDKSASSPQEKRFAML